MQSLAKTEQSIPLSLSYFTARCNNQQIYLLTRSTTNTDHKPAKITINIVFSQFSDPTFVNNHLHNTLLRPFVQRDINHHDNRRRYQQKHKSRKHTSATTATTATTAITATTTQDPSHL
jgi:hypothetical protein